MIKNIVNLFIIFCVLLLANLSFATDIFDLSVDDEIRRNYNPDKLNVDTALPPLPKIMNMEKPYHVNDSQVIQKNEPAKTNSEVLNSSVKYTSVRNYDAAQASYAMMKKGRKIKLKTTCDITDRMKKGTRISLISTYPVSTTYFTIPGGTQFFGEIADVHRPQFTGNGGLIVIKITSVLFNNQFIPLNAEVKKITNNMNSKHIFLNDIKGKRKYVKNMIASTEPGTKFCKKMYKTTGKYWKKGGVHMLMTPVTAVTGTAVWAGNAIASPFVAIFTRGESVSIPRGSILEVKLTDNLYVYK